MTDKRTILSTAREYAEKNIRIFPCQNAGRTKAPLIKKWAINSTADLAKIEKWWKKWPDALVGLPTGAINQTTVLDIDRKNGVDGFESLAALGDVFHAVFALGVELGNLKSPKVRTPSGGLHVYFAYALGVKNSAGKIGPGLDIRIDGVYVIVAGKIDGIGRYEVVQ